MDPFRDDDHAALIRAAHLEEENERLRRELEEARKPKPRAKPPTKRPQPVAIIMAAGLGLGGAAVATFLGLHASPTPVTPFERKMLEVPAPVPVPTKALPAAPDWAESTSIPSVDLLAYAQGNVPAVGYAVGKGGAIFRHYAVEGSAWTVEASGTTRDLYSVGEMLGVVCAVGAKGIAVCSRDPAKVAWKAEPTGTHQDLLGAHGFGELTAVGRNGTIVYRDEQGSWSTEASGTKADLFAVTSRVGAAYAVGAGGVIVRSDGGAPKWTPVASGTTEDLFGVAVEAEEVVVVGAHGTILRLTDPRAGFRRESSGTTSDLYGVAHGDRGYDFIAVGANGTILRSVASGWEPETGGGSHTLRAVLGSIPTMFIVGDGGTVLHRPY